MAISDVSTGVDAVAIEKKWTQLTSGHIKTFVLKAVTELRIPDIIAKGGGKLTLDEIASKLPSKTVSVDFLARIMTYATINDLFTELTDATEDVVEDGQRQFGLTALSSFLVEEESGDPKLTYIHRTRAFLSRFAIDSLFQLSSAVLTGIEPVYLAHGKDVWAVHEADPELSESFNKTMATDSLQAMHSVLEGYKGFEELKSLVDVGGGLGVSLTAIIQAYPDIKGINFDRPSVIAQAPQIPGVTHVGGDMFESVPEGEAIFMKYILHDWQDKECIQILKNCNKSLPEHGRVIIVDVVLPERKNATAQDYEMDLTMLVYTSGRERTALQTRRILKAAGFPRVEILPLPPNPFFVIEGYKS